MAELFQVERDGCFFFFAKSCDQMFVLILAITSLMNVSFVHTEMHIALDDDSKRSLFDNLQCAVCNVQFDILALCDVRKQHWKKAIRQVRLRHKKPRGNPSLPPLGFRLS